MSTMVQTPQILKMPHPPIGQMTLPNWVGCTTMFDGDFSSVGNVMAGWSEESRSIYSAHARPILFPIHMDSSRVYRNAADQLQGYLKRLHGCDHATACKWHDTISAGLEIFRTGRVDSLHQFRNSTNTGLDILSGSIAWRIITHHQFLKHIRSYRLPTRDHVSSVTEGKITPASFMDCRGYLMMNFFPQLSIIGGALGVYKMKHLYHRIWDKLLAELFEPVKRGEKLRANDVVIYLDEQSQNGKPLHFGRVIGINGKEPIVESKWGFFGPIVLHPLRKIYKGYGNYYVAMRPKETGSNTPNNDTAEAAGFSTDLTEKIDIDNLLETVRLIAKWYENEDVVEQFSALF